MSIHEIRVEQLVEDTVGGQVQHEAQRSLGIETKIVDTTKIYYIEGASSEEAEKLADELLRDPITESYQIDHRPGENTHRREVGYLPGVMNPEASSVVKAAHDIGVKLDEADTSLEYHFGGVSLAGINRIVDELLVNKKVQQVVTTSPDTLVTHAEVGPITEIPIRNASIDDLRTLSKDKLFLDDREMRAVQNYFQTLDRDPTDCELEIVAAAWSEHCGHKTFNAQIVLADGTEKDPLFKRIKDAARRHFGEETLSAFHDNSGVIKFYDGMAICGKVETHNSPSAIEPYGGAMTGSGGVFRDIVGTGQGAKTVISTDMFCFAPPSLDNSTLPSGTLRPDYLHRRVVDGVRDYGNRMGIPTANGSVHYHPDFRAKPTVIVGAYGIMPEEYAEKGVPEKGDLVVIMGGRTGRDGIHGATFSSGEMTERTATVNSSAVQIGNAIEEKRTFDAILEARDANCIRAITDCGAAGFSSAIGEMGEDIGVTVDLSKVPLKYEGLAPWEIFLSESQERMVLAIPPEKISTIEAICKKYNVESAVLGEFDGSHTLTVNYGEKIVAELDYEFLKNGLPERVMEASWNPPEMEEIKPVTPETPEEWSARLQAVLSHGNVCSKEPIVQQYDHGVQGGNIVGPYGGKTLSGPNDALVIRPLLDKPYGLVQSHGMNPILNRLDPYEGSKWAFAEAIANYVAVGGNPDDAAAINNFIWPYPDPEEMGSLDKSVDAITEIMDATGIAINSGKDSLSSTYRGDNIVIKIPPVLTISMYGKIPDVEKTVTSDIKKPGESALYLVGSLDEGMGGSTYYDIAGGQSAEVPKINPTYLMHHARTVHSAIKNGSVLACHDISEGGLASTVSEMCFGSNAGTKLSFDEEEDVEKMLFSETAGCYVVELASDLDPTEVFPDAAFTKIGVTTQEPVLEVLQYHKYSSSAWGDLIFSETIQNLKQAWQAPLEELFS